MELLPRHASVAGSVDRFTGDVWIDEIGHGQPPSRLSILSVHFAPGARTVWHSHSLGQTLCVTDGEGLIQSRGEPIVAIRVGDTVIVSADEWHWHGATTDHFMTHLSLMEGEVTWGEPVTDAQYLSAARPRSATR